MRSILVAMMWETLRRGWWSLITFGLAVNVFPCALYTALGRYVEIDPLDKAQLLMHLIFVQIYPLGFGVVAIAAVGAPARLYALPIRTSTLVALQLLQVSLLVAAEILVSTAALNALYGLRWPLWGPALFGAVAVAGLQAVVWLGDRSFWVAPAILFPGAALGLWYKAHYGPVFSFLTHYWDVVTPLDVATLTLVAASAYGVGVVGVGRNRRGENPLSIGFVDWIRRLFEAWPERDAAFRTPAEAQLWFEWRLKGWLMPGMAIVGLVMGLGMWLLASRDAQELYEGALGVGGIFVLVTFMCGFLLGWVGNRDFQISAFLATRPMTTTDIAWTILKCAAKSLFFGWLIWAASLLALMGVLRAIGVRFALELPEAFGWWYLPATLIGGWSGFAFLGPLGLGGMRRLLIGLIFGGAALLIGLLLLSGFLLSIEGQVEFVRWGLAVLASLLVAGTAAAFVIAYRRSLIGTRTVLAAASVWALVSLIVAVGLRSGPGGAVAISFYAAGTLALAVSPLATAPLALAWNRNR
jgi:hypothetical protein